MEELTINEVEENVVEEALVEAPVEILEEVQEETIEDDHNSFVIALALGAAVTAGIYGIKKFKDWRKSKKQTSEQTEVEETIIEQEFVEMVDEVEVEPEE